MKSNLFRVLFLFTTLLLAVSGVKAEYYTVSNTATNIGDGTFALKVGSYFIYDNYATDQSSTISTCKDLPEGNLEGENGKYLWVITNTSGTSYELKNLYTNRFICITITSSSSGHGAPQTTASVGTTGDETAITSKTSDNNVYFYSTSSTSNPGGGSSGGPSMNYYIYCNNSGTLSASDRNKSAFSFYPTSKYYNVTYNYVDASDNTKSYGSETFSVIENGSYPSISSENIVGNYFTLSNIPSGPVENEDPVTVYVSAKTSAATITEGEYFLQNAATGLYLSNGFSLGIEAAQAATPQPITIAASDDGNYTLSLPWENNGWHYFGENHLYDPTVWGDKAIDDGATWNIVAAGDYFMISNNSTKTVDGQQVPYGGIFAPTGTEDGNYVTCQGIVRNNNVLWKLISKSEYLASLSSATKANPADASILFAGGSCPSGPASNDETSITVWRDVDFLGGWTCEGEAWQVNHNTGISGFAGTNYQRWSSSALSDGCMTGSIASMPAGIYEISATILAANQADYTNNVGCRLFAGTTDNYVVAEPGETTHEYTITTVMDTQGTLIFGIAIQDAAINYVAFDNIKIKYHPSSAAYLAYLKAMQTATANLKHKMYGQIRTNLTSAMTPVLTEDNTDNELTAATAKLNEQNELATPSISAYEKAKGVIEGRRVYSQHTNVYTKTAYEEYYVNPQSKWDGEKYTTDEANNLQDTLYYDYSIADPYTRKENELDKFLMSAWNNSFFTATIDGQQYDTENYFADTRPNRSIGIPKPYISYWTVEWNKLTATTSADTNYPVITATLKEYNNDIYTSAKLDPTSIASSWAQSAEGIFHTNTWSWEGDTDGSGMTTPFFEYWVGDGATLSANTLSTTLTGLEANTEYEVSALFRVLYENADASDTYPVDKVFLFAGSNSVDVCDNGLLMKKGIYGNISVKGTSDSDGNLVIGVQVNDGTKASWVAWKNMTVNKSYTGTFTQISANKYYKVKAIVAARNRNSATSSPYGVTMQLNDGGITSIAPSNVDATDGMCYNGTFTAFGQADGNGQIQIKVNVESDNNINWLALRNVWVSPLEDADLANWPYTVPEGHKAIADSVALLQAISDWEGVTSRIVSNGDAITKLQTLLTCIDNANKSIQGYKALYDAINSVKYATRDAFTSKTGLKYTYRQDCIDMYDARLATPSQAIQQAEGMLDKYRKYLRDVASYFKNATAYVTAADITEANIKDGDNYVWGKLDDVTGESVCRIYNHYEKDTENLDITDKLMYENFKNTDGNSLSGDFKQTVSYLPKGFYFLKMVTLTSNTTSASKTNDDYIYMKSGDNVTKSYLIGYGHPQQTSTQDPTINLTDVIYVDGDVEVGLHVQEGTEWAALGAVEIYAYDIDRYDRSTKGKYGTICLPYDFYVNNGTTLYTINSIDGEKLILNEQKDKYTGNVIYTQDGSSTEQTAQINNGAVGLKGVPYIYYTTADAATPTFFYNNDADMLAEPNKPDNASVPYLQGVFASPATRFVETGNYVLKTLNGEQKFYLTGSDGYSDPYRCYLHIPGATDVKGFSFETSTTTDAIEAIFGGEEQPTIYDLSGRKQNHLQRGINIVNGHKVLVK